MKSVDSEVAHPVVAAAAQGRLPEWAVVAPGRREHVERVAALLDSWAGQLDLPDSERERWRAVGYLHDALRDADPSELRRYVPDELRYLADPLLHAPAAAERLRREGVDDVELLDAVAFHPLGDGGFGRLGRALYAADFLEPGRDFLAELREGLRARAPHELDEVTLEVARLRIAHIRETGRVLDPRTRAFWTSLGGEGDA